MNESKAIEAAAPRAASDGSGGADAARNDIRLDDARARNETPQVRTLLLTDLVDSTTLVERLGDSPAAELFREHDRLVLQLQQRWRGRLIDRSDGLLLLFERPVDALGFALDYNRGLRALSERPELQQRKLVLQARAGLHVGEVLTWRNSETAVQAGAKPLEVEGIAKPLAGRLMTLARPGQILLSATAEPMAHRSARELGERSEHLIWKSHGRWRLKGVPDAQEIFEVGEPGFAPLRAPKENNAKAWRDIPLWRRPAALAAEVLLLVGIGTGAWFVTRPQPAIAFNERDWVVVGDLRNLAGDARLDDSLEQAFRISLEQSRYVNVLSDLKVRETLQRMQRKPDAQVDRILGAEIALRDGARALLLPTVAEVGGRLRVSVEVVDPRTQTTVYAAMADGKGIDSALASIDEVTDQLRNQLGEAMESVQQTSVPLPNVSTPSLDALKAYALARNVMDTARDRPAVLGLYQRALQLDPQFALAHAGIAATHASFGEVAAAKEQWRKALALPDRLSSQEKLRIELMLRQYDPPQQYFQLVDQYLRLYPDDFDVIGRVAMNHWHQKNDFGTAEGYLRRALAPAAPRQGAVSYVVAVMLLGQERDTDALAMFRKSRQLGFKGAGGYEVRAYDVRRRHAEADRVHALGIDGKQGWRGEEGVVTFIDRGQWTRARDEAQSMSREAVAAGNAIEALRSRAALVSVQTLSGAAETRTQLRSLLSLIDADAEKVDADAAHIATETRLLAGLLAARVGDAALLQSVLRKVQGHPSVRDYPTLGQLHQVLLAEQERLSGEAEAAAVRLRPLARQDDALVVVHQGLLRAARQAGKDAEALAQARWLSSHRGRAFVESTTTDVLRYVNVAASTEALLEQAEILTHTGEEEEAKRQLQAFLAAWPGATLPPDLRRRMAALGA
jgi:putative peptide modification system cyclase